MAQRIQDIVVNGIVLSATEVGEADKRLVILTKQLGKITVFASGAKRAHSQFGAAANPFVCAEFTISNVRSAYRLHSVKCNNYFRELAADFDKSCYGFYFLEFAGYFCMENVNCTDYLNLLYQSFKALLNEHIPDKLVRYIFELKMFTINGEFPEVYSCCECKSKVNKGYFSMQRRSIMCSKCARNVEYYLCESALYTLQYIISADISKLYNFKVSEEVFCEIRKMLDSYRKNMINFSFKSEVFLPE